MGDIKSAQIALDPEPELPDGDAGRRDLPVPGEAGRLPGANPQDELIEAMISLLQKNGRRTWHPPQAHPSRTGA